MNDFPAEITTFLKIIEPLFDCMKIADDEIRSAQHENPEAADDLQKAFRLLAPTYGMQRLHSAIYRQHVRELLARVLAKEDTRPATDAELVVALCETSQNVRLSHLWSLVYFLLFSRVMRGYVQPDLLEDIERTIERERAYITDDEVETAIAFLRRAMAVPSRISTYSPKEN